MFGGDELQRFVAQATWVTVNDYEWQLLQQKTGWGVSEMLERVEALIVTRGAAGSTIHTRAGETCDPACAGRGRWSIRPAAAMPIAPVSSTACCTGLTGRAPARLPRSWAPSRSSRAARRITASRGPSSRPPATGFSERRFAADAFAGGAALRTYFPGIAVACPGEPRRGA